MIKKGQCIDPEYIQGELREQSQTRGRKENERRKERRKEKRKEGGKEPPACLPAQPHWAGYLGNAAGPAAGQQLTRGAEAILIEAGG